MRGFRVYRHKSHLEKISLKYSLIFLSLLLSFESFEIVYNATQRNCLFLQDVAGGGVGGGGGKGVGTTWPDTVKQSGAGGTLTPADRHGSVQVSLPAHFPSSLMSFRLFISQKLLLSLKLSLQLFSFFHLLIESLTTAE